MSARQPVLASGNRDADEQEDCRGAAWWSIHDLGAGDDAFYPGRLPELVPRFLAGEHIDEPFELWS